MLPALQHAISQLSPVLVGAELALLLLMLGASAMFSGFEVALFSITPSAREKLNASREPLDARIAALLADSRTVLVSILILNTTVNVGAAVLFASFTLEVGRLMGAAPAAALAYGMGLFALLLLILSEISPKLVASCDALSYCRRAAAIVGVLHRVLRPLSAQLSRMMNALQQRLSPNPHDRLSAADLKAMANISEAHGSLQQEERDLIHSIVEFGQTTVREIMTNRLDIVALPTTATFEEAIALIRESGHSRLPLYAENLDNIKGIIYAKDLLPLLGDHPPGEPPQWAETARPPLFVPLGKMVNDLLHEFQVRRTHVAIAVDEYGGAAGLVTMEDVLEEIVGDIRDEHDEEAALITPLSERTYRCSALAKLSELDDMLHTRLDTDDYEFETLGGLVFHLAGAVPTVGATFEHEGVRLTVESVENHRIGDVLVDVPAPHSAASAPADLAG